MKVKISIIIFIFFLVGLVAAQNPITDESGVSDPHVRVFNNKVYLYSGHDNDKDDTLWDMRDWRIHSTTDLLNWKLEGTIDPANNYMGANSKDCWAGDAAKRNGKYYFYFSDRDRSVGVMESNSPTGPFTDALGSPLVQPKHDPTIFVDDDTNKTNYIIYGEKSSSYKIAKLNNDMISLAETPKSISITGQEWNGAPHWQDKNYLFKHDNTYYLSWGRDYATSNNIYGPYTSQGSVGQGYDLDAFAHGSFFSWKGQFYHVWCRYIRNGYKFRETIISYCHFDKNGKIVTDTKFLDAHYANGVGQYNALWNKIEAEWFYEIKGAVRKQQVGSQKNFQLAYIKNGDWARYANMKFSSTLNTFTARVASTSWGGKIEIRKNSPTGPLLGTLRIPNTKGWNTYKEFSCNINQTFGKDDLYLVFKGSNPGYLFNVDWFKFSDSSNNKQVVTEIDQNLDTITLSPNPAENLLNINFGSDFKRGISLTIYTVEGKKVSTHILENSKETLDVSLLEKGVYLFEFSNGEKTLKFVKK